MRSITLLDIQKEVALRSWSNALIRGLIVFLLYILIYYFPEYSLIRFSISFTIFAIIGCLLIFIIIFDVTTSYFRGFRNTKRQITIIKMRISSIDSLIIKYQQQNIVDAEIIILNLKEHSYQYQEILDQIQ